MFLKKLCKNSIKVKREKHFRCVPGLTSFVAAGSPNIVPFLKIKFINGFLTVLQCHERKSKAKSKDS